MKINFRTPPQCRVWILMNRSQRRLDFVVPADSLGGSMRLGRIHFWPWIIFRIPRGAAIGLALEQLSAKFTGRDYSPDKCYSLIYIVGSSPISVKYWIARYWWIPARCKACLLPLGRIFLIVNRGGESNKDGQFRCGLDANFDFGAISLRVFVGNRNGLSVIFCCARVIWNISIKFSKP